MMAALEAEQEEKEQLAHLNELLQRSFEQSEAALEVRARR